MLRLIHEVVDKWTFFFFLHFTSKQMNRKPEQKHSLTICFFNPPTLEPPRKFLSEDSDEITTHTHTCIRTHMHAPTDGISVNTPAHTHVPFNTFPL